MSAVDTIIIYREELLGGSETFVLGQGEALTRFRPFYLGLRRRTGLQLPESRVHVVSGDGIGGKLQRARFKLVGPSPSLQSLVAAKRPALIHAHFGPDGCSAIALARDLRLPLVVTLHGYDVTTADALLPRLYVRRRDHLKAQASLFICVSEFIRKRAIAQGFPADRMVVHYTGIDLKAFRIERPEPRAPIVLFVGRLVPKKGCEHLIRAMAGLQETHAEAELIVIGDGPLRGDLEKQAHCLLKRYRFLGEQTQPVVRNWMSRAKVFSVPSIVAESGDAEGFGMIFAEAQAMGLPVVSFASGGIPEAVEHGQSGFLVPEGDDAGLTQKISLLLSDAAIWATMNKRGQARAKQLFDIHRQTARLEQLYDDVLSTWSGRRFHHGITESATAFVDQKDMTIAMAEPSVVMNSSQLLRCV